MIRDLIVVEREVAAVEAAVREALRRRCEIGDHLLDLGDRQHVAHLGRDLTSSIARAAADDVGIDVRAATHGRKLRHRKRAVSFHRTCRFA